jgi:hypothetical protein
LCLPVFITSNSVVPHTIDYTCCVRTHTRIWLAC